jgi:hypothetical protein
MSAHVWRDYTSFTVHDSTGRVLSVRVGVTDTEHGRQITFEVDDVVAFEVHQRDVNRLISGLIRHRDDITGGLG